MKTTFVAALFGALLAVSYAACPPVAYHTCVKESTPTKCKAVQVCENPYKEPCGDSYCEYPFACASLQKKECIGFLALKEKCGEPKKVCKEIKTPCGDGACGANQDCVKETTCVVKKVTKGRKLMGDDTSAELETYLKINGKGHGAVQGYVDTTGYPAKPEHKPSKDEPKYQPVYGYGCGNVYGSCGGEALVCSDSYKCVAKEPCKDIVVKKCVKSEYKPGVDVCFGGKHFLWYALNAGEMCGHEICGYGYECAEVIIQKCKTQCGKKECDFGYECVEEYDDKDCDQYAYLAEICRDVYEPVCVQLPASLLLKYKPPCKTIFKCETEDSVCGNQYCPAGYVCAVDTKKTCGGYYYTIDKTPVVAKPEPCPVPVYSYVYPAVEPYTPEPPKPTQPTKPKDTAYSGVIAVAGPGGVSVDGAAYSSGEGSAEFVGLSQSEEAASYVAGGSSKEGAGVEAEVYAEPGSTATATGEAEYTGH